MRRSTKFDLYVKQVGQERVLQLTHHPAIFLGSAWSPDGRLIAFMRQAEPDATGNLRDLTAWRRGAEANLVPTMDGIWPARRHLDARQQVGGVFKSDRRPATWAAMPRRDVSI